MRQLFRSGEETIGWEKSNSEFKLWSTNRGQMAYGRACKSALRLQN